MAQAIKSSESSAFAAGEFCPWCDQPISHDQFEELRERIEEEKKQHAAEVAAEAKAQVKAARKKAAAELEEAERVAKEEAEAARKKAAAELKEAERVAKETASEARAEGRAAAEAELVLKLAAADEEKALAKEALASERDRHEKVLNERLLEQRDALEKEKQAVVNAEKANAFAENEKLEAKVAELQRQLKKKTREEPGEGADLDLVEELKAAFPTDEIKRVKKGGETGANIVHRIIEKGRRCGVIVYDSKNRTSWRNSYVEKLRRDQLAAKADHAILASQAFPAGTRQLDVRDGVIVANPARVVALTEILRTKVVQLFNLRLSNEERAEKVARLYDFITSEHFSQLLGRIDSLTDTMLELDVKEKKAHDATWERRGELLRSVQQARGDLATEVDMIIAAPATKLHEAK